MKTKQIIIVLLISLLFLTGCQEQISKKTDLETKKTTEKIDLEIYQSSELGVQFQYPKGLIPNDCSYVIRLSYQQYPTSICQEGPKETMPPLNVSDLAGEVESSVSWHENQLNVISKENITVAGNPAVKLVGTWIDGGMNPELKDTKYEVVFVNAGTNAYTVDLSYLEIDKEGKSKEEYKRAFDQILQSLEFTN